MHVVSRSKSSNSFEFIEKICAKKKKEKIINCLTEMAKKRIEGGDNEGASRRLIGFYFTRK